MFTAANVDLFIPILVSIAMMRLGGRLRIPVRALNGVKLFVPRYFTSSAPAEPAEGQGKEGDVSVEDAISKLNFTMVEVSPSKTAEVLLSTQPCCRLFELIVQLTVAASTSLLISKLSHCVDPTNPYSCWVVLLLVIGLTLTLNGLFVTADGELAVPTAMLSFIAFLGLLHFAPSMVLPNDAIQGLCSHLLAMLKQISANPPACSRYVMMMITKAAIAIGLAVLTAAMVTPARRWGQLVVKMSAGRQFERAPKMWLIPMWIEYAAPLPILFLYSKLIENRVQLATAEIACTGDVCPADAATTVPSKLFIAQILAVLFLALLKFGMIRRHLQSFLDYSVETLSLAMVCKDLVVAKKLKTVIEERSNFLMTATTQAASVPILAIFWLLLKLRHLPHSTGLCHVTRSMLRLDTTSMYTAQQSFVAYNSTMEAITQASMPYFDQAIGSVFRSGAETSLPTTDGSASLLSLFASKMSMIYYPPASVSKELIDGGIFWTLCIWFLLSTGFLIRWLVDMQALRTVAAKEVI